MKNFKLILIIIGLALKVGSQTLPYVGYQPELSPGGIFDTVFDQYGSKYPLSNLQVHGNCTSSK